MTNRTRSLLPSVPSKTWRRWHKINACFLGVFILLHLFNHVSGIAGIEAYHAVQKTFRLFYKNPIVEPMLLLSITIQIILGIILLWKVRKPKRRTIWTRIQFWSGLIFLLTISQHLIAFANAQYGLKLDTSFYWPASVMNAAPWAYYFGPYYFLMVSSLIAHIAVAIRAHHINKAVKNPSIDTIMARNKANCMAITMIVVGMIIAALIVAVLGQVFYDIELPKIWRDYLNGFS